LTAEPGDVVLLSIPQLGGGGPKLRPALVLAHLPGPYQSLLVCGISSQLGAAEEGWDEVIDQNQEFFATTGLRRPSVVRLSYLYAADADEPVGRVGSIPAELLARLKGRLALLLQP
jgi:mRNA interferase MazF